MGERVPFTITAETKGPKQHRVRPRTDYPLVFEGTVDGAPISPSVSRIFLDAGRPGKPFSLAPKIRDVSPKDGAVLRRHTVTLKARITDALSGVDPSQVAVQLDGTPVDSDYDPDSGRLSACLRLEPGQHTIRLRAVNHARAPTQALVHIRVR